MEISYTSTFIKKFKSLSVDLQSEALEKIQLFKDKTSHKMLKVHKLHGKYSDYFSFSVDYKTRIVFTYHKKHEVIFTAIGDHDVYK